MSLDNVKLHLVDDFDTATQLIHWMGTRDAGDAIAVDTETTGLIIGKDRVRLTQFGGREHGWAIPHNEWRGLVKEICNRWTGRFIMHNATFDAGMLEHEGVHIPRHRIDDTRIMSHILEPNMSTALKTQASRHIDAAAAGAQAQLHDAMSKRTGWTWATIPIDYGPYWQYAALDTVLTAHLYDRHYPLVMQDYAKAYELESDVVWVIEKMERNGTKIDVDYARNKLDEFIKYVEESGKFIEQKYGMKPGSNAAIIKYLSEDGVVFTKATKSGAVSLDKEVLGGIDHELAITVLRRRQLQKLASTYLSHFVNDVDANNLIHPKINTLGARTSRMSMENPNLQNLPRPDGNEKSSSTVIRNAITTRYGADGLLLMCDFEQVEMRILASLSNDPGLIVAFSSPNDFFVELAREIFSDPTLTKKDPRRSLTKNTGYAKIYGAGIAKMALTAGVSEAQAALVMNGFDQRYPHVRNFQRAVDRIAWDRQRNESVGYVKSPLTGRRHIADQNKMYTLVNYLIQGTAAEILKMKIVELDSAGVGDYLILPVHDEVIADVPRDKASEVVHILDSVMNDDKLLRVPIKAAVSYGTRWGEKKDWDYGA